MTRFCAIALAMSPMLALLGCGGGGFDMNVACSASTFALHMATNLVRAGAARQTRIRPATADLRRPASRQRRLQRGRAASL